MLTCSSDAYEIGIMADRLDSERLRGFDFRKTDRQTDICDCRVAFATENTTGSGV